MLFVTGGAFTPKAKAFLEAIPNPRIEKPFHIDDPLFYQCQEPLHSFAAFIETGSLFGNHLHNAIAALACRFLQTLALPCQISILLLPHARRRGVRPRTGPGARGTVRLWRRAAVR